MQYALFLFFILDKIITFLNKLFFDQVVGTPTEATWPGVSQLPNYRKCCQHAFYRPRRLVAAYSRLHDLPYSESLASHFIQVCIL